MKIWALLAGGVTLLFGWLALRGAPVEVPTVAVAKPAVVQPAALPAPAPLTVEAPAPRGIRVHGVLQRGGQSHALLSIEGAAAHVFGIGDKVTQGWSLASVEPDHVVLAQGLARARLSVNYSVESAPAAALAAAAPQAVPVGMRTRSLVKDEPLPGFVKADGTTPVRQPNPASNRRFLEDHQKRMAMGKP